MANEIQWGGGNFATNQGGSIGTIKDTITGVVEPWNMGCGRDSGKTGTKLDSQGNKVVYDVRTFEPALTRVGSDYAFNNEPQAENTIVWSEDFSNSSWTKTGVSASKNVIISPDGNATGNEITEDNSNGAHGINTGFLSGSIGEVKPYKMWFKKRDNRSWILMFDSYIK